MTTSSYFGRTGGPSVSSNSNSSPSSSSSSSSSSSDSLSLSSVSLPSTVDENPSEQEAIHLTESVEKYLTTLNPFYRFTALRIRNGDLSPTDAINNEATIDGPIWVRGEPGKRRKIELQPIIKDFIVSGLVALEIVQKLSPEFTPRSLKNLSHPMLEDLFLSGKLTFEEALTLSAEDLRYLSTPAMREWLRAPDNSVFWALL